MSFRRAPRHTAAMLRGIRGNARVLLLNEPLFVIPFGLYTVYASLYMRELGLSARQIGLLASVGAAGYMAFSTVAGHIVDRLGRRRTTLLFDLVAWSLAMLLFATARNFPQFLLATLANSLAAIPATAWSCWLVEDYQPEERLPIFTALQMATPLGAFFTPLGGWLIRQAGVVPGTRLLYVFAFVSMTAMFFIRNRWTTESRVGAARQKTTGKHTFSESWRDYGRSLKLLAANRTAMVYFVLTGMLWFRDSLVAPFVQLLLVDRLEMPEGLLAVFPAVGGAATIVVLIYVLPYLLGRERVGVAWGLLLSAASIAVLLFAPAGNVLWVSLSNILGAAGLAVLTPALNTGWNNALGDAERAKVLAIAAVVWSLMKLPAGYVGGVLYHIAPVWPFVACMALLLLGLPMVYWGTERKRERGMGAGVDVG
ncbi:MAG: MFS transporter [Bacteroidota bacterium]